MWCLCSLWITGITQPKVLLNSIALCLSCSPLSRLTWICIFLPLLNTQWTWKTFLCVTVEIPVKVQKRFMCSFSHSSQFLEVFLENSPLRTKLNLDYGIKPTWSTFLGNFWKIRCCQWNLFFTLLPILQKAYSSHQCCHARQFSKCFLGIALAVFEPWTAFR